MGKSILIFAFIISASAICAQEKITGVIQPPANPCNGFYKENIGAKKPVPYTNLREADVALEKRVWREIDLREKINQPLYYPVEYNPCRASLFQVINREVLRGNIIAFADENFQVPYNLAEIRQKMVKQDSIDRIDFDVKGEEHPVKILMVDSESVCRRVTKFRLKEDWYFDKQKSSLEVRIIGIAAYEWVEEKEAFRELYWVYFPSCRPYFAANDVFNTKNDSERRSFDELFWKRMFSSVVIKESNVYDRYIAEYQKGIDALTESENIKLNLFNWEQDLWNY